MRGVSASGGGGGVDDRVMCFSINWSMSASEDWFLFRPCVGSGWGDGDRFLCRREVLLFGVLRPERALVSPDGSGVRYYSIEN